MAVPQGVMSDAYRNELIELLTDFIATRGLDYDGIRRAEWLRAYLRGDRPEQVLEVSPAAHRLPLVA